MSPKESLAMKTKAIGSIFVLFAIVAGIATTVPAAFADHAMVDVSIPSGSGVPGCEDTNECYLPPTATVDAGGQVTWTNNDSAAHTVTSATPSSPSEEVGALFDSSLLMGGLTYSWTFEEVGTVDYFCIVHPWMQGMVVVQEAGAEEPEEHEELTVMVNSELADGGTQINLEFNQLHVNYVITATQDGEVVFEDSTHSMEMTVSHMVDVEASEESPLDIEIVSLGVGLPGANQDWKGTTGTVATQQVVPEFGTIAMMILAVSIISIIAVTAKTRVIPRL